jgi:SAM-dependent methyltransferase
MSVTASVLAIASQRLPRFSSRFLASSGYTLDADRIGQPAEFVTWQRETAERQNRAWMPLVAAAKAGKPREDIVSLYDAINSLPLTPTTLLEVGCGGGYNAEILHDRFPGIEYEGVDISPAMVEVAKENYPQRHFSVGSAYDLEFADRSFDVVMDGVALLHMAEWPRALAQYARVARFHVILHGLTLTVDAPTTAFAKFAYGQPSHEFAFDRNELLGECAAVGLSLVGTEPGLDYDLSPYLGIPTVSETWVLVPS